MKLFATLFAALALFLTPAVANEFPNSNDLRGEISTDARDSRANNGNNRADDNKVYAPSYYRKVVTNDFGGSVIEYIMKYNEWRQSGMKVRIDDLCMSACTMIVGLMPKESVCVSPFAQLAFHSAWVMTPFGPMFSPEGTRILWEQYPERVRTKLRARGWDVDDAAKAEHPNFIYFKGTEFYELCEG